MLKAILAISTLFMAACTQPEPEVPPCEAMCANLLGAPLRGCGDSDAATELECVSECYDQLADGDASEADVSCGAEATTCDEWRACGNLI
jgi:hypothetical protein